MPGYVEKNMAELMPSEEKSNINHFGIKSITVISTNLI